MKIIFACGAAYELETDKPVPAKLQKMVTFVNDGGKSVKMPTPMPGSSIHCLMNCPATVRASKREAFKAWVGEGNDCSGEPVWMVRCMPVKAER